MTLLRIQRAYGSLGVMTEDSAAASPAEALSMLMDMFVNSFAVWLYVVNYFLSITFLIAIPNPSFVCKLLLGGSGNPGLEKLEWTNLMKTMKHLSKHFASHVGHEKDKRKTMDLIEFSMFLNYWHSRCASYQLHWSWAVGLGKPIVE